MRWPQWVLPEGTLQPAWTKSQSPSSALNSFIDPGLIGSLLWVWAFGFYFLVDWTISFCLPRTHFPCSGNATSIFLRELCLLHT